MQTELIHLVQIVFVCLVTLLECLSFFELVRVSLSSTLHSLLSDSAK